MIKWLRKNAGIIASVIGVILLAILTYGDMGQLFTDKYWENVGGNISSISALTIGLVLVQVAIKQGLSEQALSKGLNTQNTKDKYEEHRKVREKCRSKQIYLPYFLNIRNKRQTKMRKEEFLVENNFSSEKLLFASKNKRLIRLYLKIRENVTMNSIIWSTTEIRHSKNGRIEKLNTFRSKRAIKSVVVAILAMFATTLITGGLFLDTADIPFWQKTIKLLTYLVTIAVLSIFDIEQNYEKGAFGVPNELDEINGVWEEFYNWEVPAWVKNEVLEMESELLVKDEEVNRNVEPNEVEYQGTIQEESSKN